MTLRPRGWSSRSTIAWDSEPDLDQLRRSYELLQETPSKAVLELESLADRGSVMSMRYLAHAYRHGLLGEPNAQQAEAWYSRAVEAGSIHALHELGTLYWNNLAFDKAFDTFSQAAARDFAPSMNWLGIMYYRGTGPRKNVQKAREFWERSIELGNIFSKKSLAMHFIVGHYGLNLIPRGICMWLSGLISIPFLSFDDPNGDELM